MTTRVYLVRHGATTLSAEDRFAGATDVPLSDLGRAQVESLAARLAPVVSDAARASLEQLYPDAARVWPFDPAEERSDDPAHP